MGATCAVLEQGRAGRARIAGDPGLAVSCRATIFMDRDQVCIRRDDLPNVVGWIGRLGARESWHRAVAPRMALFG